MVSVAKTNQDIAERISESLPVKLDPHDVDHNPEFIKLLTSLSEHVRPNGCSTGLQADLCEAEDRIKHAKDRWLQYKILYTELEELLVDHELQIAQGTPSSNSQFYKAVRKCLTSAEIGDYLECSADPASETTLFGLTRQDIERRNPHKKHLQSIQQKLIPEIESRLWKKCETLVNFHQSPSSHDTKHTDSKFTLGRASQLLTTLEAEKQQLEAEKQQLKREKRNRDKQSWQYYQTLMESLNVLEVLVKRHRLEPGSSQSNVITSDWLTARCNAMNLKIKMLEMQLLCDTYHTETVQALAAVRHEVDNGIKDTQQEIQLVTQALAAYESIGMGFDSLVEEYTQLREEVENKKWAVRELKHSLEKE